MKILRRVTMEIDTFLDNSSWETLQANYDLVALQTNERNVFEQACQSKYIDIISLDCTQRLPFTLDPMMIQKAIENNIYFELCYAPGIRDDTSRGYVYQLGLALISSGVKDHLIISSGAIIVSELRAPFDIYYFAKSFGLANDEAKFTYWKTPESLITLKSL
ncbi:RNase P subunit p30 [Halteromyces radiatus]|uniref:RNase P subunit p30 n=1 Tax=Halteromyces radiatus TaxID=101107 RepID=UPI00221E9957|nr:RNase P subunit p30 [Halteromyces radiatus]KAI8081689.1 RNase P subunit p30 [Halteromyces radiatus]